MPVYGTTTAHPRGQISNDAEFRAYCKPMSDFIQAAGFIKTADTGQIDWDTVTYPGTTTTVAGYEVYRFDDVFQATAPIFFKMEWGRGNGSTNVGLWLTFGNGSDGAGNLTGFLSSRIYFTLTTITGSSVPTTAYWCGDAADSRLCFFIANVNTTTALFLSFERTINAAGNRTADGVLIVFKDMTTPGGKQLLWLLASGDSPSGIELLWGCMGPNDDSATDGVNIGVFPIFLSNGIFVPPGTNVLGYMVGNLTTGLPTTITMYGAAIQYMPIGPSMSTVLLRALPIAASSALIRYDPTP